ncbi:MAG: flagellar basal-body MS-ring/collar protein FliF [Ahrensia sp.]|nr:flagellar basal-body MS-ring/collar protein FliF [Ahrensia sp.]
MPDQIRLFANNLQALGTRRLIILGGSVAATIVVLAVLAIWASRPPFTTLYTGLQRDDINRMGPVLSQAGIAYDVDSAGGTVLVETGQGSRARMILAEQGLPRSSGSGYELFDTMGSLGLTSFMQEVTRVRALEGEVARSVRLIEGVRAARVHIVLPDRTRFSNRRNQASASVLIRADRRMDSDKANAIRHLVAASVPGLDNANVTVLGANGTVLAAGRDPETSSLTGGLAVQRMIEGRLSENIARMLEPWLGVDNFRVSVRAALDTSEKRIEETTFDPDSRVERSVQVVRVEEANSQRSANAPTTIAEDLPEDAGTGGAPAGGSNQSSERREETTNYEINSKKTAIVQNGFSVTALSASVVVNLDRLNEMAGGTITQEALNERLASIQKSVLAAAGFDQERGDIVNVEALTFTDVAFDDSVAANGIMHQIAAQTSSIVKALAFVAALFVVLFFGLRPAMRMVMEQSPQAATAELKSTAERNAAIAAQFTGPDAKALPQADRSIEARLQALADQDEERAAEVLRSWLNKGGEAPQASAVAS